MKKILLVTLLLAACGTQEKQATNLLSNEQQKVPEEEPSQISFAVSKKKDLPVCDEQSDAQLAYVKEKAKFYTCTENEWAEIEFQTAHGDKGEKGDKGDKGDAGTQGVAGTSGTDGSDGLDGQDGANGVTPYTPAVYSATGLELGRLVDISEQTNRYWVIKTDGTRLEIGRDGTLYSYTYFYAGANCSGERRFSRTNGLWANAVVEERTGKIFKQTGTYQNTWAYASKSQGLTCSNTASTINKAFAVTEITLTGYGSWGEVEIAD